MIRVGLIVPLRGEWQGGVNYFHNLLSCYKQNPDPDLKLIVLTGHPEDATGYQCNAIEVHHWPGMPQRSLWNIPRRAIKRFLGSDFALVNLLKRHRIDFLSHLSPQAEVALGSGQSIRAMRWMPDFQHKRLPQFFRAEECTDRDCFVTGAQKWGHLLLSSHAAESDFRRYFPSLNSVQTHVLHFSCPSVLDVAMVSHAELEERYSVSGPYFYLPNQFWQHKNHAVVVDALRQCREEIRVICTGPMNDYRFPDYVPSLMEKVRQDGLERRFITLGVVPYPVLASLMHYSLAVLQPSLFEGWSTTVEEAKAMCKQIIVSDIDVHREQAPERATYFSQHCAEELAACLERVYSEFNPVLEKTYMERRLIRKSMLGREWIPKYVAIMKAFASEGQRAR